MLGNILVNEFCNLYNGDELDVETTSDVSDDESADNDLEALANEPRNNTSAAGGRQGQRNRPSQLIPDGLTPRQHLDIARVLLHPIMSTVAENATVELALSGARRGTNLVELRYMVCDIIMDMLSLSIDENFARRDTVRSVLRAYEPKSMFLLRQFMYICLPEDYGAASCLVLGLPMMGWAFPAYGCFQFVPELEIGLQRT